jgi:hypothetical protein
MTDPLTLLRDADPAARVPEADAPPPRHVLDRIVATPQRPPRRRRALRLAVAVAAAAVAVAAVVVATGKDPDLAARAYAATAAGDGVLYTEVVEEMLPPNRKLDRTVVRAWQRGDRVRRLIDQSGQRYELVTTGDGVRIRLPGGHVLTDRDQSFVRSQRLSFVERFRLRYDRAALREAGRTTFAGRPAVAYVAEDTPPDVRQTFYLDAESGHPLGSYTNAREFRITETLRALERLPATPENLAQLEPQPR